MAYDSDPSALGRIASQRSSEEQIAFALRQADPRLHRNQNGKRLHQLRWGIFSRMRRDRHSPHDRRSGAGDEAGKSVDFSLVNFAQIGEGRR